MSEEKSPEVTAIRSPRFPGNLLTKTLFQVLKNSKLRCPGEESRRPWEFGGKSKRTRRAREMGHRDGGLIQT